MKRFSIPLVALLLAASLPAQAASSFDLATATGGGTAAEYTWDAPNKVLTVNDTADITITGTVSDGTRVEVAAGATAAITLDGVSITGLSGQSPLLLDGGAVVTLHLSGTSTLTAGDWAAAGDRGAGIHAPSGTTLNIDGAGTLTATGGSVGAGIGGSYNFAGGNITISGGTVIAKGGSSAAGIGGGNLSAGGHITINGDATVIATGGTCAAGIGGGVSGAGGVITITDAASVTATGGACYGHGGGAGIGSGSGGASLQQAGTIKIDTTGAVTATGGTGGPAGTTGANIGQGGYTGNDGAGIDSFTGPASVSTTVGGAASFTCSVHADGAAPTFTWDWQFSAATPPAWSVVGGAADTLNVSPVAASDAGQYRCEVTASALLNDGGSSIVYASGPVRLTVQTASSGSATSVPTLGELSLALLALLLAGMGLGAMRRGG